MLTEGCKTNIFEVGLEDTRAIELAEYLKTIHLSVKYVISSKTMLMAYKTGLVPVNDALVNNFQITFVNLKHMTVYSELSALGTTLSSKCHHLRSITLSQCCIEDAKYEKFSKSLFYTKSTIFYLRKLDISFNNLTSSCVNTIVTSLKFCIIENLVISDNKINKELSNSIFNNAYNNDSKILNFTNGIPLIIVNSAEAKSELLTDMSTITIFLCSTVLSNNSVSLLTDELNYNIYDYKLYLIKNNILKLWLE